MDTDVEIPEEIKDTIVINNENTSIVSMEHVIKVEILEELNNHDNINISSGVDYDSKIKERQDTLTERSENNLEMPEKIEPKDTEFDTFIDDKNQIYKKYKLREKRKLNYRIPTVSNLPEECNYKTAIKTETVKCPQCNQKYERCSELRKHVRNQHKIIYTCIICKDMFDTNAELITHKKLHQDENTMYLCLKCQEAFSDHCDFLLHELTHINIKLYTCQECGYIYHKKHSFEVHLMTHFNRLLKCPICSKEVNGEIYLKQHINQHNVNIKCVECGLEFNEASNYKRHMDIHTGIKRFLCLYCGKGFRLNQQRVVHTRTHTQENKFSCTKCDKKFKQKIDLMRHIVKHDAEKHFKCTVCSKEFKVKFNLASHMRVHAKEYECPICHKKLSSQAGLRVHMLYVHTTERLEACNICKKQFVNKNQLSRHYRSKMHKNNEYKFNIAKDEMMEAD